MTKRSEAPISSTCSGVEEEVEGDGMRDWRGA
jgi:hypothetical protein